MNGPRNIERTVVKFFEDNHLNAKAEWLEACLEYHISTNPQVYILRAMKIGVLIKQLPHYFMSIFVLKIYICVYSHPFSK